jgi:hypothetical protein
MRCAWNLVDEWICHHLQSAFLNRSVLPCCQISMQKATGGHLEVLHGESKAVSDQVRAILLHIIDRQGIGFDTIWVCKTGTVSNPAALVCTQFSSIYAHRCRKTQSSQWCIQCHLHQTDLPDVLCIRSTPLGEVAEQEEDGSPCSSSGYGCKERG